MREAGERGERRERVGGKREREREKKEEEGEEEKKEGRKEVLKYLQSKAAPCFPLRAVASGVGGVSIGTRQEQEEVGYVCKPALAALCRTNLFDSLKLPTCFCFHRQAPDLPLFNCFTAEHFI